MEKAPWKGDILLFASHDLSQGKRKGFPTDRSFVKKENVIVYKVEKTDRN